MINLNELGMAMMIIIIIIIMRMRMMQSSLVLSRLVIFSRLEPFNEEEQ